MAAAAKDSIVLCTDPILAEILGKRGINARVFDTILSVGEQEAAMKYLDEFAARWFFDENGNDYTLYRKVSIGAAIYQETLSFFHLLTHFVFIVDKLVREHDRIEMYQSVSCRMPQHILDFLAANNIPVHTVDEQYPYLCFAKDYEKSLKSSLSSIDFSSTQQRITIRKFFVHLRSLLIRIFSSFVRRLFFPCGKYIYFSGGRSLSKFYHDYLATAHHPFGLNVFKIFKYLPSSGGWFGGVTALVALARKGVVSDTMACPPYFKFFARYAERGVSRTMAAACEVNIARGVRDSIGRSIQQKNLTIFLGRIFQEFVLKFLSDFFRLIEYYYARCSDKRLVGALQEFIHPFQSQVMANLGKPCLLVPRNYLSHNQYFAPSLFSQTGSFFQVAAISSYDVQRYRFVGFPEEAILTIGRSYWGSLKNKQLPFKRVDSLAGAKVLVLPPVIDCLNTFRLRVPSQYLYAYFDDVLRALKNCGVEKVTIRPHPGGQLCEMAYFKFLVDRAITSSAGNMAVCFSDQADLDVDILASDLVVGTYSASALHSLILGRDYVFFDGYIIAEIGRDRCSLLEGMISRLMTSDALRAHLAHYQPITRELFLESYYDEVFVNSNTASREDRDRYLGLLPPWQ